jgi:hypothetical protein
LREEDGLTLGRFGKGVVIVALLLVAAVKVGGETVSALPFSVKEEKGSDPFNPTRRFTRGGAASRYHMLETFPLQRNAN